jgi:ABC-type multidrug transport system ATPase subunit
MEELKLTWKDIVLKTYDGKIILSNANASIQNGKITAVMGPSGSGKSSLLNCLTGRNNNKMEVSGDVKVNGKDRDQNTLCNDVSYVGQEFHSHLWQSGYETLCFAVRIKCKGRDVKKTVENVIELLGLKSVRDTYVANMSGGEKVRIGIGIELLGDPKVILLDEPLSCLDSCSAFKVLMLLRKLADLGKCILFTVHQPSYQILEHIDEFLLMSKVLL